MESTLTIDSQGNKRWFGKYGFLHRENGPAVEWANGDKKWFLNGFLHNENGPAVVYADGHKEWWIKGRLRENGPAIEWVDGSKSWCKNGVLTSFAKINWIKEGF